MSNRLGELTLFNIKGQCFNYVSSKTNYIMFIKCKYCYFSSRSNPLAPSLGQVKLDSDK
jgi:hypothetical protein